MCIRDRCMHVCFVPSLLLLLLVHRLYKGDSSQVIQTEVVNKWHATEKHFIFSSAPSFSPSLLLLLILLLLFFCFCYLSKWLLDRVWTEVNTPATTDIITIISIAVLFCYCSCFGKILFYFFEFHKAILTRFRLFSIYGFVSMIKIQCSGVTRREGWAYLVSWTLHFPQNTWDI